MAKRRKILRALRKFSNCGQSRGYRCHKFEIRPPLNQLPFYTSRKCKTTIKLQIVSTHALEIIDAAVGFPGSIGDARVFRLSPLSRALGAKLVRSNYHILGDTAYPLRQHLLVPFRNNHELENH
uniref:DDE Tnp4 domain-containing protein n=1 Tax=Daphnia galeata TaxID=27404 RepID=A0A8J2WHD2_9CRUS|nr:unnamed protein product [Daphnia galeata]